MSADVDILVVGAGHAGLGVAARLHERGSDVLVIEAKPRIGDTWRERWPSLRLFTPRFMDQLPGTPFPTGDDPFPNKDEVADYQERFAVDRGIAVRTATRVDRIRASAAGFAATFGGETITARGVAITTGAHQVPNVPPFAVKLGPAIHQLHSLDYGRAAASLPPGPVLVVGARNSGVEIAAELARTHEVTLAVGSASTYAPARWRSARWWRVAQLRNWLLRGWEPPGPWPWPIRPPRGRWIEVDLGRAAREGRLRIVPRIVDATSGALRPADGREIAPRTVIWATGFRVDDSWIDAPSGADGIRVGRHRRALVPRLWVVRAGLLASVYWGAAAVAADALRRRS